MKSENNINIFKSYDELVNASGKHTYNARCDMREEHYKRDISTRKGWRGAPIGHGYRETVRDDYFAAYTVREKNFERYLQQYRERNPAQMSVEQLRHVSLWLDENHRRMQGYHNVDTSTKYCPLHLKDENPYLYMGIELELTWDDECVDGYTGDRYDEYGDYDECGDYDDEGNYIPDYYEFDINEIAKEIMRRGKGLFTTEEDGSLYYGYSLELVSRPLSTRAWHSPEVVAILEDIMEYAKSTGALVEQPEGNGFHIHVSKKFFGANPACNRSEGEVARDMNWVFQKFQEEIETIGGREYNEWCASAKMNIQRDLADRYGIVIDKAHIAKKDVQLPYGDHHRAFIDSTSGNTFEARVFHSTLDVNRILACIEFMRNISHGARENALEGKTFGQITRYKDAPNLQMLIKRIKGNKQKLALGKRNTATLAVNL